MNVNLSATILQYSYKLIYMSWIAKDGANKRGEDKDDFQVQLVAKLLPIHSFGLPADILDYKTDVAVS